MVDYKWTQRNLRASQTGLSLVTQQKFINSLGLPATTATLSKATQKSHDHYWTSQRKPSSGTGGNHNTKRLKNSRHACAPDPSSHNPTSINHSSFKPMHRLMAWAPYSHKRVNIMPLPPKNQNYIRLHSTLQHLRPPNGTTTSTSEN